VILDWDITQIEGAMLDQWLPKVFARLEELSRCCGALVSLGAFIEDKNSGMVLLQHANRRQWPAQAIGSKLTSVGKDERAISVSDHVHCGKVKYTDYAFTKEIEYKQRSSNHLVDQKMISWILFVTGSQLPLVVGKASERALRPRAIPIKPSFTGIRGRIQGPTGLCSRA
jgi:hypothetical protein